MQSDAIKTKMQKYFLLTNTHGCEWEFFFNFFEIECKRNKN